ncbi:protein of unknown function [Acidithiobacillus ferrivorans]|uniref:Uncharacterized protein n=1 Tax=Acidithiobacillus ferrivorans TaxID=160808 RepID=A0ABY1MVD6_9PROT|nr:protein of unknown function [Acidithiobacillus ferrivorans]
MQEYTDDYCCTKLRLHPMVSALARAAAGRAAAQRLQRVSGASSGGTVTEYPTGVGGAACADIFAGAQSQQPQ